MDTHTPWQYSSKKMCGPNRYISNIGMMYVAKKIY
jgi:hypothetical protein